MEKFRVKVKSMEEIKKTFEGNVLYSRHTDDTQTFTEGMAYFCGKEIEVSFMDGLDQYRQTLPYPADFCWHKDWIDVVEEVQLVAGENLKKGQMVCIKDGMIFKAQEAK